jgi:predicted GNAT family N-acyltransferase
VNEVFVRRPYPEEMEAVYELRQEVLGEPIEQTRAMEEASRDQAEVGAVIHAAGFDDDKIVATGRISEEGYRQWILKYIAVDADYRLQGIGATLLTYLEHAAAQAGAEAVEVKARNGESDGFYHKMGYTPVASDYVKFDKPHIRMRKNLRT